MSVSTAIVLKTCVRILPLFCALCFMVEREAGGDVVKKTYTYKRVGDLAIELDVYREDDSATRPVVVWIHGGALINGHREAVPGRLKQAMLDSGFIFASIDYRLAPETQLPAIIQDLEDAFAWIREEGPARFHADPRRIAVTGGSAGGYMSLAAGFRVRPRVQALVAFWGYGDLVGPWYSTPSPHPCHQQIKISREEAFQQVSGPPVSDARHRKGNGGAFYQHCRQHGLWPKAVSGWDPHKEAERFVPFMPVTNVDQDFPPTLLIHGTADTDVPHEQSVMMAVELKRVGVTHRLISVQGGEHGLAGADREDVDRAYQSAIDFVRQQLVQKAFE